MEIRTSRTFSLLDSTDEINALISKGDCYKENKDDDKAAIYYQAAYQKATEQARKNVLQAKLILGIMYEDGIGIKKDYRSAIKWYRNALEQNPQDSHANFLLGHFYEKKEKSLKNAIHYYKEAAARGHIYAKFALATFFANHKLTDDESKQLGFDITEALDFLKTLSNGSLNVPVDIKDSCRKLLESHKENQFI